MSGLAIIHRHQGRVVCVMDWEPKQSTHAHPRHGSPGKSAGHNNVFVPRLLTLGDRVDWEPRAVTGEVVAGHDRFRGSGVGVA